MVKSLADVPVDRVFEAQQAAQMRLQLYMVGKTHKLLGALAERARRILDRAADNDGKLDSVGFYTAQSEIEQAWAETFGEWKALFSGLRWEAGSLPFGTLAVLFERFMGDVEVAEGKVYPHSRKRLEEQEEFSAVYEPQLQAVLAAAAERVYGDGFNLSQRIWRLDHESLDEIRRILAEGIAAGDSAWQIARRLEGQLGAGRECPRWTSTRLYRLTKGDIAGGNRTGLYSGDECAGQGVSYNALRLARNELQIVHAMATDEVMRHSPWVEQEKVNLSPAHPQIGCACEPAAAGGENSDGVYPVGTIILPLHVQCMCYKTAVMMDEEEFTSRLRGWMNGTAGWPEMDDFAEWIGAPLAGEVAWANVAVGIAGSLATWLWGDEGDLDDAAGGGQAGEQLPLL